MSRATVLLPFAFALSSALLPVLQGCAADYEFWSGDEQRQGGRALPQSGEHVVRKG